MLIVLKEQHCRWNFEAAKKGIGSSSGFTIIAPWLIGLLLLVDGKYGGTLVLHVPSDCF